MYTLNTTPCDASIYVHRTVCSLYSQFFNHLSRNIYPPKSHRHTLLLYIYIYACGLLTTKPRHHKEEKKTIEKYTQMIILDPKIEKKICIYSLARIHHSLRRTSCYNQYIHHCLQCHINIIICNITMVKRVLHDLERLYNISTGLLLINLNVKEFLNILKVI